MNELDKICQDCTKRLDEARNRTENATLKEQRNGLVTLLRATLCDEAWNALPDTIKECCDQEMAKLREQLRQTQKLATLRNEESIDLHARNGELTAERDEAKRRVAELETALGNLVDAKTEDTFTVALADARAALEKGGEG